MFRKIKIGNVLVERIKPDSPNVEVQEIPGGGGLQ